MEVIPAIDLRHGRCVRLHQGDYDRETVFGDDPVAMARHWQQLGAPRLHVVDLDAAKGDPPQSDLIAAIVRAVDLPVQVGGGLRTREAAETVLALGAERIVLGTAAVREPDLVRALAQAHVGALVVAVDARDGQVAVDGWRETTPLSAWTLMEEMTAIGVQRFLYTDIAQDATMEGPNFDTLEHALQFLPADRHGARAAIIAAGGVGTLGHIRRLAALGVEGAVVGQALYAGAFTLPDAIAVAAAELVEE